MKRLHYFQHVPFEAPGLILDWARKRGIEVSSTEFFLPGEPILPEVEDCDFLVVMGGPMGVYELEEFSWLGPEIAAIGKMIHGGSKVLGICLGAQLARMEAALAFEALVTRLPGLRLDGPVAWGDNMVLRGPVSLPVAW